MKTLKFFVVIVGILSLNSVVGCESAQNSVKEPIANAKLDAGSECRDNAGCALIKADCCGCQQGGKQRAVALAQAKEEEALSTKDCEGRVCMQMISTHESCQQSSVCENGRCILR